MVHRRVGIVFALVVYGAQCAALVYLFPTAATIVPEIFAGVYVLQRFFVTIFRRVETHEDSFTISGFYHHAGSVLVQSADLISVKFSWVRRTSIGRTDFDFLVVGLRAQSSPYDYRIALLGWSSNRKLYRCIMTMLASSQIGIDERTRKVVGWAAKM